MGLKLKRRTFSIHCQKELAHWTVMAQIYGFRQQKWDFYSLWQKNLDSEYKNSFKWFNMADGKQEFNFTECI